MACVEPLFLPQLHLFLFLPPSPLLLVLLLLLLLLRLLVLQLFLEPQSLQLTSQLAACQPSILPRQQPLNLNRSATLRVRMELQGCQLALACRCQLARTHVPLCGAS